MTAKSKPIAGNTRDGLLVNIGMDLYEGSRPAPGGKFETKRFRMRRADALREFSAWNAEAPARRDEAGGKEVAVTVAVKQSEKKELYVLCIVGGAPLFAFCDFDKAASVCSALEAAAKASGFAAKYDVVAVKEWNE